MRIKKFEEHDDLIGNNMWFEYHCFESPESVDAELWYHSHQLVTVLSISEMGVGDTIDERLNNCCPRVYSVKFSDNMIFDVFEDELYHSPNDFCRPDPPKKFAR